MFLVREGRRDYKDKLIEIDNLRRHLVTGKTDNDFDLLEYKIIRKEGSNLIVRFFLNSSEDGKYGRAYIYDLNKKEYVNFSVITEEIENILRQEQGNEKDKRS